MTRLLATGVGLALALVSACTPGQVQEQPTTEQQKEQQKIEALIKHVEELKDAKFVRNDTEYDAPTAARFLRGKWESSVAEIKTARDFIAKAGSVSSTSGKPYLIRFKDGKEVKSGEYLLAELEKIEKAAAGK